MLVQRMIRAARLDPDLYYELERDRSANEQAFLVVLIVLACWLIGTGAAGLLSFFSFGPLLEALASFLCGWLFWALIAMHVGMRFGSRADFEQVMRPTGFAHTPGVLYLFAFFPGLGRPISLVVLVWTAIATVIAVREAMHFPTGKAVWTAVLTTAIVAVISAMLCFVTGRTVSLADLVLFPLGR